MRKNLPSIIVLVVTIAFSAWGFNYLQPNEGQARFRGDTITVNAVGVGTWGADISQMREWGVPIEFVDGEADVTFVIGETSCQIVPGFGKGCAEGETSKVINNRHWVESCTIVLREGSMLDTVSATAVVTHEFGHCLGAEHNKTTKSIMATAIPSKAYTPANWSWHVTDVDRASIPY